jgi:hypothetical protein
MKAVATVIQNYLKLWAKAPLGEYPEPPSDIVEVLRSLPETSFNAIAEYKGPLYHMDPRDAPTPLGILLSRIADLVPDLLIPQMTEGFWAKRYMYINAAAMSQSSLYDSTLAQLLRDRSIYIKTLVLQLILDWPHLRTHEMLPHLEKLRSMKTFQKNNADRDILYKVFAVVPEGT